MDRPDADADSPALSPTLPHLRRTADRGADVEALVSRVTAAGGARVGLAGVLAHPDRRARRVRIPAQAAGWGWRWDRADGRDERWWPQGVATPPPGAPPVLVTSAYAKPVDGVHQGARLTFVDLSNPTAPRYRHVLLVEVSAGQEVRPVRVHAGGLAWHAGHVHVAATGRGLVTFRLDDVLRLPAGAAGLRTFGFDHVLPVRHTWAAETPDGREPVRYSFLSVDRTSGVPQLVAGEYGRGARTTRLLRYALDPEDGLPCTDGDDRARPVELVDARLPGMQGATVVAGRWYVTTSHGRYRRGSVWVGGPGRWHRSRRRLPVGPEDLAYWPERDELWTLSEYPGARYVLAVPRARLDEP